MVIIVIVVRNDIKSKVERRIAIKSKLSENCDSKVKNVLNVSYIYLCCMRVCMCGLV